MKEVEYLDLVRRAQPYIGRDMPVNVSDNGKMISVNHQFTMILPVVGFREGDGDMMYRNVLGELISPNNSTTLSLKVIVDYFESLPN